MIKILSGVLCIETRAAWTSLCGLSCPLGALSSQINQAYESVRNMVLSYTLNFGREPP